MDLATIITSAVFGALAGGASSFLLDLWRSRREAHLRRLRDARHRVMALQHWLLDLYAKGLQGRRAPSNNAYADLEWIGDQRAMDAFGNLSTECCARWIGLMLSACRRVGGSKTLSAFFTTP